MNETKELPSEPGKVTGQFPPRLWGGPDLIDEIREPGKWCAFEIRFKDTDTEYLSHTEHEHLLAIERERSKRLAEALEEFQLGHKHEAGLDHIRVLGDSYGYCDYCQGKVDFGPGFAEQALAEDDAAKGEKP